MSRLIPYPFQEIIIQGSVDRMKKGVKPFLTVAATGSGKSLITANIAERLDDPLLILQPNKEILLQNYAKILNLGVTNASLYSASVLKKNIDHITYATIGSIKNYDLFRHFKYIIVDEAHLINPRSESSMYMKLFAELKPKAVNALTATPYRLISSYFEDELGHPYVTGSVKMLNHIKPFIFNGGIPFKIEMKPLMDNGTLSPIKYYVNKPDLSCLRLKNTGLDFTEKSLAEDENLRESRLLKTAEYCVTNHKKVLTFMSSISGCNKLKQDLAKKGIHAEIVTAYTPGKTRDNIVNSFKQGSLRYLINMGVFTVGFDVVDLDCVIWNRSTISPGLYVQVVGRLARKDPNNPNKIGHFYDLAGTARKFGKAENIRIVRKENDWKYYLITTMPDGSTRQLSDIPLYTYFLK